MNKDTAEKIINSMKLVQGERDYVEINDEEFKITISSDKRKNRDRIVIYSLSEYVENPKYITTPNKTLFRLIMDMEKIDVGIDCQYIDIINLDEILDREVILCKIKSLDMYLPRFGMMKEIENIETAVIKIERAK